MGNLDERFWSKVQTADSDVCWEWQGATTANGYGAYWDGKALYAHRVSWELEFGDIPEELCVLHHCDNPGCVNPKHLFLGTKADNTADMVAKGRQARGSRNGMAKLNEANVLKIRELLKQGCLTQVSISEMFGVARNVISQVSTGKRWAWLGKGGQ